MAMQEAIPLMRQNGGGVILNTASEFGLIGWGQLAVYSAAKSTVIILSKSVALETVAEHIRVNALCPGMTFTGLGGNKPDNSLTPSHDSKAPNAMERMGLPSEQAAAALFLCSDDASYITGIALPVDGGGSIECIVKEEFKRRKTGN
jgi:NAD(P)-dependent dehydrogenase (short-subunit alcohol dehydrogenase family)